MITYLGLLAAAITSAGPFLQMVKTMRTRETDHLSWGMWISFCIGITLWIIYGIVRRDVPVIVANVVTLLFSAVIVGVMVQNRRARVTRKPSGRF
ncbi:MAG: SemiSWEET transporter [Patescibacteria group bacterium]